MQKGQREWQSVKQGGKGHEAGKGRIDHNREGEERERGTERMVEKVTEHETGGERITKQGKGRKGHSREGEERHEQKGGQKKAQQNRRKGRQGQKDRGSDRA